jgi:hypothetical protein
MSAQAILLAYLAAFLIGVMVGLAEVLSRYRDAPVRAARTGSGIAYILFNGLFALLAMFFVHWVFPLWSASGGTTLPTADGTIPQDDLGRLVSQTLLAGFGAMAVLRSSLLTTRIGTKDVEVGPAAIIDIFRNTMDRGIARVRAEERAALVSSMMGGISFLRSYSPLGSISLTLLQSIDADERKDVEQQIGALANQTGRTDRDKSLELGLILAGSVGFPALKASIAALGDRIENSIERPAFVAAQVARLPLDTVLRDLPAVCLAINPDVPGEEQRELAKQIDAIAQSALSDQAKRVNVGLLIVAALGEENLRLGVDLLAGAVEAPAVPRLPQPPGPA